MPVEQSASALHLEKLLTMSDAEIQEEIATLGTEAKGLIVEVVGDEMRAAMDCVSVANALPELRKGNVVESSPDDLDDDLVTEQMGGGEVVRKLNIVVDACQVV